MDVNVVRAKQAELARNIDRLIVDFLHQTGVVPMVEIHCHEHRTLSGSTAYTPVVRVYSCIPEVTS